jgi:hypothetical protein
MAHKAFTTFGGGATPNDAIARPLVPLPPTAVSVVEVQVPDGVNPSKFATWVQRCAVEQVVADDVPGEHHDAVRTAAGALTVNEVVAAVDMAGNPAGEKMRDRLGCGEGERPWLLFGIVTAPEGAGVPGPTSVANGPTSP